MHVAVRFMRGVLEMLLSEQRLGVSAAYADTASVFITLNFPLQRLAPALRGCLSSSDNGLKHFAKLTKHGNCSKTPRSCGCARAREVSKAWLGLINHEE